MCVHGEARLQIIFIYILTYAMKLFMDIPFLLTAQETSLLGHNFSAIQLSSSYIFALNYLISTSNNPYRSLICSAPKCTFFPQICIIGLKKDTLLRFCVELPYPLLIFLIRIWAKQLHPVASKWAWNIGTFSGTLSKKISLFGSDLVFGRST